MIISKIVKKKKREKTPSAYRVGPCVYTKFMTTHILFYEDIRTFNDTRAYNEESRTKIVLFEEIEELPIYKKRI